MTAEELKNYPLALERLKLFGLTEMHEQGYDGRDVTLGMIDVYTEEHGHNIESTILEPYVNDQMFGTAPNVTIKRYPLPKDWDENDVVYALKDCLVDEVDIINMSLKVGANYYKVQKQVKECYKAGILMVAAAGNDGKKYPDNVDIKTYPEEYEEVVSVGSVDSDLKWSDFESHGKSIEVVGIGKNAVVKMRDGSYQFQTGTSDSSGQISGLYACVLSKFRQQGQNPTPDQLRKYVNERCVDMGTEGRDNFYGFGIPTMDIIEHMQTRRELGLIRTTVKMQIGNNAYEVNGETKLMDTAPIIDQNNRTLTPARAVAEALGASVKWDHETQTVIIEL